MSAAAAKRRKRKTEDEPSKRLWVDPSHLPKAKQVSDSRLSSKGSSYSRYLELADLVLGRSKDNSAIERRRNKQKNFRGIERRSSG